MTHKHRSLPLHPREKTVETTAQKRSIFLFDSERCSMISKKQLSDKPGFVPSPKKERQGVRHLSGCTVASALYRSTL